jgi:hypothetical protein
VPAPGAAVTAEVERPAAAGERPTLGHCHLCGRAVRETVHERAAYAVDGFVLYTGETEEAVIRRGDADEAGLVYRRLVRPVRLLTCADCYADPVRRARHRSWRYPGD